MCYEFITSFPERAYVVNFSENAYRRTRDVIKALQQAIRSTMADIPKLKIIQMWPILAGIKIIQNDLILNLTLENRL